MLLEATPDDRASASQRDGRVQTRRVLTLPRPGDDLQRAVHVNMTTSESREGRAYSAVVVRSVSKRRTRELELYPNELRAVATALQRAAAEIERMRA